MCNEVVEVIKNLIVG